MHLRSGSPGMQDIEAFSKTYRARLDEAELAKTVPENISLEVYFLFLCSISLVVSFFTSIIRIRFLIDKSEIELISQNYC